MYQRGLDGVSVGTEEEGGRGSSLAGVTIVGSQLVPQALHAVHHRMQKSSQKPKARSPMMSPLFGSHFLSVHFAVTAGETRRGRETVRIFRWTYNT